MKTHRHVIALAALLALAAAPLLGGPLAAARATTGRTVKASAICIVPGPGGPATPVVEVTLSNHTGAPLSVVYVHGFTTGQVFAIRMRMAEQPRQPATIVPDGATRILRGPWDDLRPAAGTLGGALIVTSAGALTPVCGSRAVDASTLRLGPAPTTAAETQQEGARLAAETIGRLESWRAYPALYALLHPDARAEVPFAAVACWYAGQYGLPGLPAPKLIFDTTVTDIQFGAWTWAVSGRTYALAAEVSQRQQVGTIALTEPVSGVEHLVYADGFWRWFFATSAAGLAAQPTDCHLGAGG